MPEYAKPPIVEAILDIRLEIDGGDRFPLLRAFFEHNKSQYPQAQKISEFSAQLTAVIDPGTMPKFDSGGSSAREVGVACISENRQQIVHARVDGFAFSWLAPYAGWKPFCAEAMRLWTSYNATVGGHSNKVRIALRTINQLRIPGLEVDLKDWLRTFPEVSPDLPQGLTQYFMQLNQPHDDLLSNCIINQVLEPASTSGDTSVILDVDLFRTHDLPSDEVELWNLFAKLRERKDTIFEGCITDKMRERFQ